MKKIYQLAPGDVLYKSSGEVVEITSISHGHSKKKGDNWNVSTRISIDVQSGGEISISSPNESHFEFQTHWSMPNIVLYTTKYEALLNRKRDLLHDLEILKRKAIEAVNAVRAYREKYYQELNIDLRDSEIEKLKREI